MSDDAGAKARALVARALDLRDAADHDAALQVARDALEMVAGDEPHALDAAGALVVIGHLHNDLAAYAAAETAFQRAVSLVGDAPVDERAAGLRVRALDGLATMKRVRGHYGEAETIFRDALALAEARFGPTSLEVATVLNDLAITFKYSGRFADAEGLYLRSLGITEAIRGPDHPDVAGIYHNLGGLEHARGDYPRAEGYARKSVEIRARGGGSGPALAADKAALASILDALGKTDEAERFLRDALAHFQEIFGDEHYEIAINLNNLAAIVQRRGDVAEAARLYERSLAIKEKVLGRDHPEVAISLNNLAVAYKLQDRLDDAERLYRRALALLEGAVEPSHPNLLRCRENYAALLRAQGRTAEADELERAASAGD